jgi:hypothetical protein
MANLRTGPKTDPESSKLAVLECALLTIESPLELSTGRKMFDFTG